MKSMTRKTLWLFSFLAAWLPLCASAVLKVEITQGMDQNTPIAIVPFTWQGAAAGPPENVSEIVSNDLIRSGKFAPIKEQELLEYPQSAEAINFPTWRISGVDYLVIGKVISAAPNNFDVQFQLFDVVKGEQMLGYSFAATEKSLRRVAHHISDLIYERLTGEKGAFNTQVAYVTVNRIAEQTAEYKLQVSDTDGHNPQTILSSTQPIMSPAWSPDARSLAYVSFENGNAEIYIQELATGQRRSVSSFKGLNGAPAWSPDGKHLAMTLSKDGNPDIYVLNLSSGALRRLTNHWTIDTEPAWMPDGKSLIYTSSRSGKPQLYKQSLNDSRPRRITFEGNYNAGASVSADGRTVSFVNSDSGGFRIAVMDLETGFVQPLTDGPLDESPSFAPNGSMILYATQSRGRGVLAAVSKDGRFKQRLVATEGDVREPTWSPFPKQ